MTTPPDRIENLKVTLETFADNIFNFSESLAETLAAISEADEHLETIRAAKLAVVLNDRFEINRKLKHTNEDQRKIAVLELVNADPGFIGMATARKTLIHRQATQKAEIEKNRNLHKTNLLVLQFYANRSSE